MPKNGRSLETIVKKGKGGAHKIRNAQILLLHSDENGERLTVEAIAKLLHCTAIHEVLKKTNRLPHLKECWVIPPEQDAAFVAAMEDVLEVYHRPFDPDVPVVCMDSQPIQLTKETRSSLPMQPEHPERYDYEYERNGTAGIFMFCEPPCRKTHGFRRIAPYDDGLVASGKAPPR